MIFKGKTLCVCLAIDPSTLKGTKYSFEDISSVKKYDDVPVMVRVRSQRSQKYVLELIDMMMADAGLKQLRAVKDEFDIFPPMSKAELVENGAIKVMMTDGNGEIVAPDFETMKNSKFNLVSGGIALHKHVSVEEVSDISDETVAAFIEIEADTDPENDDEITYGSKKGIINIDTISSAYNDGDVVTLDSLISKGLVAKNVHFIKVLARGELDKALTIKAHDYSMDAVKMIVVAGGTVIELKSQKVKM
jgi:ribosomal protein L15